MEPLSIDTPVGPAAVHLLPRPGARAALVLGHGAGGGTGAVDLRAASQAAQELGLAVALAEQPYRVAGRRTPPRTPTLDAAWTALVDHLATGPFGGLRLVTGGRSSGARVACRTALATGSAGVLCLAFPLQPPPRRSGAPAPSRLPELAGAGVPVLVVQGRTDPFGVPPPGPGRTVVTLTGDHSLRSDVDGLRVAVRDWLVGLLGGAAAG